MWLCMELLVLSLELEWAGDQAGLRSGLTLLRAARLAAVSAPTCVFLFLMDLSYR